MLNLQNKVTTAIATGSLLLTTIAAPAFGATHIDVSDNGAESDNTVDVRSDSTTTIDQNNDGDIDNSISVSSNTGGNTANRNTRGDSDVTSGDTSTSITVRNQGNTNRLNLNGGTDEDTNGNDDNDGNGDNNGNDDDSERETLRTTLNGDDVVPGPGDSDGTGNVRLTFNVEEEELCARLRVRDIETSTGAQLREGEEGENGPSRVTLPTPDEDGFVNGCVEIDEDLAQDILDNPENYYVTVRNDDFPDGALRGQLE